MQTGDLDPFSTQKRPSKSVADAVVPPAPEEKPVANAPAEAEAATGGEQQKKPMRIGERLVNLGLISEDQLQVALTEQKNTKKLLGSILVELGFITESALGEVLAETSGAQKFDTKSTMLDTEAVRRVPKDLAVRQKVIPVSYQDDVVQLAMADVYNVLAIDQVR